MKKRFLAMLLCLCMVATLVPTVASANEPPVLYVGDTNVLGGEYYIHDGDGGLTKEGASADNYHVHYDAVEELLTLKNADITKNYVWGDTDEKMAALYANCTFGIELLGDNSLSGNDSPIGVGGAESYGIYIADMQTLTIQGGGSLSVTGGAADCSYGMFNEDEAGIDYKDGTVVAKGHTAASNMDLYDVDNTSSYTAVADTDINGTSPVSYDAADLSTYKYISIFANIWVGDTLLTNGSYYKNDGAGGITEDGADADTYNVAYIGGVLTLRNADIIKNHTFGNVPMFRAVICSETSLQINLLGENAINGAAIGDGASYNGSYGILAGNGSISIHGSGSLVVTGGAASASNSESAGLIARNITIESGTVTAFGSESASSFGITGSDVEISGGNVTAIGGTNNSAGESFGLSGYASLKISGGNVTATGGNVRGGSVGLYGEVVKLLGGEVKATGGIAEASYGVYIDGRSDLIEFECKDCVVEVRGGTNAFNMLPSDNIEDLTIQADTDFTGTNTVSFVKSDLSTYKYILISGVVRVGGTVLKPGSYYLNDGAGGITEEGADANHYNVAYTSGNLTLKDANIAKMYDWADGADTYSTAILSHISLHINLIGENNVSCAQNPDAPDILEVYGINAEKFDLSFTGTGRLTVTGGRAGCSSGVISRSINMSGGNVTAIGGSSTEQSTGVFCESIEVSGNAVLHAVGGEALFSIGIFSKDRCVFAGGIVTATGSTATAISSGMYGASFELTGGSLTVSGGDAESSFGVLHQTLDDYGDIEDTRDFVVSGGMMEVKGNTVAMSMLDISDSYNGPYTVKAGAQADGSAPEEYVEANLVSYKYLRIDPAPVFIAGQPMTANATQSSYYINEISGYAGSVTTIEPADWNAKLELVDGNYQLTLNGLELTKQTTGIQSYVDLILYSDAENINKVDIKRVSSPALDIIGDLLVTVEDGENTWFRSKNGINITGNLTVEGRIACESLVGGLYAIHIGGDLDIGENGVLLAYDNENGDNSRAIKVDGDVLMNGSNLVAYCQDGVGMDVNGSITLNKGMINFQGKKGALNKQPQLGGYDSYLWCTNMLDCFYMPYDYDAAHTYLDIIPTPHMTVGDVTVNGAPNTPITSATVHITVDKRCYISFGENGDVSSWFTNMPQGLTATASEPEEDGNVITVTISGTPTENSTEAMTVVIPVIQAHVPLDIYVAENTNAKWNIQSSNTYALNFETNGGSAISTLTEDAGTVIDLAAYKPTKANFDFDGWYSDSNLTTKVTSVTLNSDITVYAKWTAETNPPQMPFTDVPDNAYYRDAVIWAVDEGITAGTAPTMFSPDGICTRAQAVTFLWRASGSPAPETTAMPFRDVPTGSYYYTAVLWAVENGVTAGTSSNTFSPDMNCSRAQIVTMLWRMEGSEVVTTSNPFADVAANTYYTAAVLWAVDNGVTAGTSATTFSPDAVCTRAQIVTFIYRYMK